MLTLEAAKKSPNWLLLTTNEKAFISAYLTNGGDKEAAALASFNIQPKNAAAYGCRLLAKQKILVVLGLTKEGKLSKKEFLELTAKQMRACGHNPATFFKLAEIYKVIAGWAHKKEDSVDDIVRRIEKRT